MEGTKLILCIFLDLAKDFTIISYSGLIKALEQIGFRGTVLSLMQKENSKS